MPHNLPPPSKNCGRLRAWRQIGGGLVSQFSAHFTKFTFKERHRLTNALTTTVDSPLAKLAPYVTGNGMVLNPFEHENISCLLTNGSFVRSGNGRRPANCAYALLVGLRHF